MSPDAVYSSTMLHQIHERNPVVAKNPPTERQVKNVTPPIAHPPRNEDFYMTHPETRKLLPNVNLLKHHFLGEGRLTEEQAHFILEQATELMALEPNLLHVESPVTVCGDIHGQYYDLMKIFDVGGTFEENNYLFLGDYVDRGSFGIECLLYLYALKLWHPKRVYLLRGNHECRHLTEYFTFKRECLHKYSEAIYNACIRSFHALPVTALVDGKFFCVHGGISPSLDTLEDLKSLNRFEEPASQGLLCDLLWADPIPNFGHEQDPSYDRPQGVPPGQLWEPNHTRGCSFYFTYEAACKFLERNQLLGIFRGHEAQDAGYTMHRKTPTKKFPSVITIFSAPNYLDVYHNRGAVIKYKNKNITIRQYNATTHPYWLPNFMDAFTWSLPFVGEKITEMLLAILAICSDQELESVSSEDEEEDVELARARDMQEEAGAAGGSAGAGDISQRRMQIKSKIMAVGRMQRVFHILREEAENATELVPVGQAAPGAWPGGFSLGGGAAGEQHALGVQGTQMRRYIRSFDDARKSDLANERLPEFDYAAGGSGVPLVPAPSMMRMGSVEGVSMEEMIKRALEEEGEEGSTVEQLADRIARGRRTLGRPRGLKRFETA